MANTTGKKFGGRTKGTPNRDKKTIEEKLAALGCDPIEGMARIAMDEAESSQLRGKMFAELAKYTYPQKKAIEVKSEMGQGDVWAAVVALVNAGGKG